MKWATWITFILGLWLIVAPFALGYGTVAASSRAEDVIMGILIAAFSLWASLAPTAPAGVSWLIFIFGIWVLIAPFVLGFSHASSAAVGNNVIIGIVTLILGLISAVGSRRHAPTTPA